ncbi:MAG: caspase family protein [Clostridia bacterium]|nr:caspase family protein [Clostridia bacterium]
MKKAFWLVFVIACLLIISAHGEEAGAESVRRALLIGCDAFVTQTDTTPAAAMNVERMTRMLQTDMRGYAAITQMGAGVASRAQLIDAIHAAFDEAEEGDVSLLYICTHGLYDRVSYEPLLVLSDGQTEDNISAAALRLALDGIAGHKIVILDACNSGAFIGRGVYSGEAENAFATPDYTVLTSAGAYEDSLLWSSRSLAGGSYFAQELCEGLRTYAFDLDADGSVTAKEVYKGLLESHGASAVQMYPESAGTLFYVYDPELDASGERPLSDIVLDSAVLDATEDTLFFSFTVRRPVRVQYQLIYYENGEWRFDAPQLVEDEENIEGALSPGRKERSLTLVSEEDGMPYGYVLLQIVAQEGRNAMIAASRLITVQPDAGDPQLRVWCDPSFSPRRGQELAIYVHLAFPCCLTVRVRNEEGDIVRRLSYKMPSRPIGQPTEGSFFYWDGCDSDGVPVPAGAYVIEASTRIGDTDYTGRSGWVSISDR